VIRREGALLLDLDGVLFDSEPLHQRAWENCVADLGACLEKGWYEGQHGRSLEEVAGALTHALPGLKVTELKARKRAAYLRLANGIQPFPGVVEALLEASIRAAVVSSSPREEVRSLLRGTLLERLLDVVISGDDVAAPKPKPDGYLEAMRRLALSPDRCVAIEDSDPGIQAAIAAGLRVVAVTRTGRPPQRDILSCRTSAEAIGHAVAILAS